LLAPQNRIASCGDGIAPLAFTYGAAVVTGPSDPVGAAPAGAVMPARLPTVTNAEKAATQDSRRWKRLDMNIPS